MTVTYDQLGPADASRCAELEAQLFDGDDPWPAVAFLRELAAKHIHYAAARADEPGGARLEAASFDDLLKALDALK